MERKLAAILFADVVGYSRLMETDEAATHTALKAHRAEFIDPTIGTHHGHIIRLMGDGALVEFPSVVEAVQCAAEIQKGMEERNAGVPKHRCIEFRIGVNLGDVIVEGADIYGDGVNIAARLQELAEPGGVVVSRTVYTHARNKAQITFERIGERQLKNIEEPLEVYRMVLDASADRPGATTTSVTAAAVLLARPAVAILPFANLSGDPEQEYFADGITEDLMTALAHWRWLPVIDRNSTFAYKGKAMDITQIGRELKARYALEGSVRRANERVRIAAQLIDAGSGHHLWAQSYDRQIGDVFRLQDEITRAIVGAIEPQLSRAEQHRALRKPPANLDVWDLSLRALWHLRKATKRDLAEADRLLAQAAAMDPTTSQVQSLIALCRFLDALAGWTDDPGGALASTLRAAQEAVALDEADWLAHALFGIALLWTHRQYDRAIEEQERSLALNPSGVLSHQFAGCVRSFAGEPATAIPHLKAVLQLDPRYQTLATVLSDLGLAYFLLEDLEEGLRWFERAIAEQPGYVRTWQRKAACLGYMGRIEAGSALAKVIELQPGFSWDYVKATYPFRDPRHAEMFAEGLRKAGLGVG